MAAPGRRTTVKKELADAAAGALVRAKRALFITGAGLSADSGLPTYRGVGGLYDGIAASEEGLPIEQILSGTMLRERPELTWRYLHQIELACRGAQPNRGHEILAALDQHIHCVVFTQNVDGFHRAAGSRHVIEIHGDLHDLRCTKCTWRTRVPDFSELVLPPRCPSCGRPVRPDVVLFGEPLPNAPFAAFEDELARGFDVVFSIGTSALFPYVARPVLVAKSEGIPTIEINPGTTELSDVVDLRIKATARTALKAIYQSYRGMMPRRTEPGR